MVPGRVVIKHVETWHYPSRKREIRPGMLWYVCCMLLSEGAHLQLLPPAACPAASPLP